MPNVRLISLCALAILPFSVSAQQADETDVVVTASRIAVAPAQVGSSLTVIDRETLAVRQLLFVSDALRDVPGVAVSRGGGLGAVTQVRVRGTEGNHALVLIDGVEANNPVSNSEFDFANLLVADIERIEILRGPQSALYGSDAIGGVINIITREYTDGLDAMIRAGAGNLGTQDLGLRIGGGGDRYTGGASLTRFASDGENIARTGPEKDGFENDVLTLHGRALLGDRLALKANLRYIESTQDFDTQDFDFPATPTQGLVVDDDVAGNIEQLFYRFQADSRGDLGEHRFGLSGTHTKNVFFGDGLMTGQNQGDKTKLDYQFTLPLGRSSSAPDGVVQALTLAAERELVDYENRGASPLAAENQRKNDEQTSVVAEYRAGSARADFSASARLDRNELFEDASTFRLTGSFALNGQTRLHTSFGTGVTNPGFFELFGFFPGSFIGNPALAPEQSRSFDIGVERLFDDGRWRADITYFDADLREEIQTTFDTPTFLSSVTNLPGDSERRGAEMILNGAPTERWQLAASYTYTDARQPDGLPELRRAKRIASLDNTVELAGGRARVHLGIDYNGPQVDSEFVFATPEERVTLPSFTLVTLAGDFAIDARWRLYARAENLLDEEYEEWFGYRGRGRAVVAGFELALTR